jgi:hypothetical protein
MKVLKPLVTELVNLLKKGVNLAKDELPVIANQILAFYFWASVIWVVAGVVLMLAGLFCHVHAIPYVIEGSRRGFREDDPSCMWVIGAVVAYLAGAALVISNSIDIVKIKAAPRLFLLEYLKGFLETGE